MTAPTQNLTREELRWLGLTTLAAVLGAVATEGVKFAFSELERVMNERREAARKAAEDSKAWRDHLEKP